ncbi:heavy-metal-associated domain-containing protein [Saccharicrinis aurantiacus]|uniref:heavy-metal-associated domain-containing protein n=1 Tax=Saccharicrinis aurantiacus TaxID=1849719 RepID=UPI00094FB31D|nr:heavy metal-associated domain-containing protein [Saccharicrinis aurantiacus]
MKNLLLVLLFTLSVNLVSAKEKGTVKQVTYECSIDCHDCKEKIMKNISYEKGVKSIQVDIPTKLVKIKYRDDKTDSDKLKKALEKLGYETKVVPAKKG